MMSRVAAMRSLTESLARSYDARMAEVAENRAQTAGLLRQTHAARMMMAADQQQRLGGGRARLAAETAGFLRQSHAARMAMAADQQQRLGGGRAHLAAETAGFLRQTHSARMAMAAAQSQALEEGLAALRAGVSTTLEDLKRARAALVENLVQFGRVWRSFGQTMRTRRTGAAPRRQEPEAELLFAPRPSARSEASIPSTPLERTVAGPSAREIAEEHERALVPAVFAFLADRPDGVRLVELEEHFGIPRIRLALLVNRLIEGNKARKDEERKLYFAT